jgi:hypothetical protein
MDTSHGPMVMSTGSIVALATLIMGCGRSIDRLIRFFGAERRTTRFSSTTEETYEGVSVQYEDEERHLLTESAQAGRARASSSWLINAMDALRYE